MRAPRFAVCTPDLRTQSPVSLYRALSTSSDTPSPSPYGSRPLCARGSGATSERRCAQPRVVELVEREARRRLSLLGRKGQTTRGGLAVRSRPLGGSCTGGSRARGRADSGCRVRRGRNSLCAREANTARYGPLVAGWARLRQDYDYRRQEQGIGIRRGRRADTLLPPLLPLRADSPSSRLLVEMAKVRWLCLHS